MKLIPVLVACLAIAAASNFSVAGNTRAFADGPAALAATKPAPDVKYPYTFKCIHCGMKITVNSEKEWQDACAQCACGMKNIECYPTPPPANKKTESTVKPPDMVIPTGSAGAAKPAVLAAATAKSVAPAAKADAKADTKPTTYPYTFKCAHCGLKITVKNEKEWQNACEQCACGMKNADCLPKK